MYSSGKRRIFFVNGKPRKVKTMREDGVMVEQKLPGVLLQRKFVTTSGNVVAVTFGDGKGIGSFDDNARPEVTDPDNSGALQKWKRLLKDGALLYSECPYAPGGPLTGKKACKGHDGQGRFWTWKDRRKGIVAEDECCEHITEIALARQKAHTEKQAELAEQFKSSDAKLMEQMLRMEAERLKQLNTDAATRLRRAGADVKD